MYSTSVLLAMRCVGASTSPSSIPFAACGVAPATTTAPATPSRRFARVALSQVALARAQSLGSHSDSTCSRLKGMSVVIPPPPATMDVVVVDVSKVLFNCARTVTIRAFLNSRPSRPMYSTLVSLAMRRVRARTSPSGVSLAACGVAPASTTAVGTTSRRFRCCCKPDPVCNTSSSLSRVILASRHGALLTGFLARVARSQAVLARFQSLGSHFDSTCSRLKGMSVEIFPPPVMTDVVVVDMSKALFNGARTVTMCVFLNSAPGRPMYSTLVLLAMRCVGARTSPSSIPFAACGVAPAATTAPATPSRRFARVAFSQVALARAQSLGSHSDSTCSRLKGMSVVIPPPPATMDVVVVDVSKVLFNCARTVTIRAFLNSRPSRPMYRTLVSLAMRRVRARTSPSGVSLAACGVAPVSTTAAATTSRRFRCCCRRGDTRGSVCR